VRVRPYIPGGVMKKEYIPAKKMPGKKGKKC
jgi:hypothetical protein